MLHGKSDFGAKCVGQIYMIFSFKISMMTFEATFSDSYGLKECITIELKFKYFLLLWEISVLKIRTFMANQPSWQNAYFVSELLFSQHFHFVHIFHIKFNKYVRTCKRKLRSELVPRWTNWIMGDTAAIISRLSYYFLLRNSNLKWPNPISLLKTIFEMC